MKVVLQDLLLQHLKLRARLDAERVDQMSPHPRVRRQRIGLPAGAIERRHQRGPESLTQRIGRHQRLQLSNDLAAGAQIDPRSHGVLDQAESHLLQTRTVRHGPVTGVQEHVATKQRKTLPGPVQRTRGVIGCPGRDARVGQHHHPPRVNGFPWYSEGVAVAGPHHQARVPQRTTQLRNLRMQRIRLRRLRPQILQDRVGTDPRARLQRQAGQQLRGLAPRQR